MKVIGVDTGNRYIKTVHAEPFSTGIVRHGTVPPAVQVDTLFYEGQYYALSATRGSYRCDKTADDHYLALTLIAIAKEIMATEGKKDSYNKDIVLAMDLPLSHIQMLKDKYKAKFSNNGQPFVFQYNGIPFSVLVREVMVFAQGFAAVAIPEYYTSLRKRAEVYIIDIGGWTTDVIKMVSGVPQTDFCISFDKGVIHLYNAVQSRMANEMHTEISDVMIDAILRGEENPAPQITSIVLEEADRYARELMRFLEDKKVNFQLAHIVFLGGGAMLMEDSIRQIVPRKDVAFIEEVRANVIGCERQALTVLKARKGAG